MASTALLVPISSSTQSEAPSLKTDVEFLSSLILRDGFSNSRWSSLCLHGFDPVSLSTILLGDLFNSLYSMRIVTSLYMVSKDGSKYSLCSHFIRQLMRLCNKNIIIVPLKLFPFPYLVFA